MAETETRENARKVREGTGRVLISLKSKDSQNQWQSNRLLVE